MIDVILPAMNEEHGLAWLLPRMPAGYSAIVVDNGSDDATVSVAIEAGALVVSEAVQGFGAACWRGLLTATTDVVCFMDADGSLDPADLPAVADPVTSGRADLVLGARRAARGAWPPTARFGNRLIARRLRRRAAVPITDLGPMRAARRRDLLELRIADRRFGWPLEMVVKAAAAGWRVIEVPVPYGGRRGGRSKVTGTVGGTYRTVRDMTAVLRAAPW